MRKMVSVFATLAVSFGVVVSGGLNPAPAEAAVSTSVVKSQPLTSKYKISSGYGYRIHPVTKKKGTMHRGLDYPASCGKPILSSMDGTVHYNAVDKYGWGNYIVVKSGKFSTLYAHMSSRSSLKAGTKIYRGQRIGTVGKTGMATGCHLHFEFRDHSSSKYGFLGKDFNPASRMKKLSYFKAPVIVKGSIKTYYKKNKTKTGDPTANEKGTKKNTGSGVYQSFDKGVTYYSKKTGSHLNKGAIRKAYVKANNKKLGFPTTDEYKSGSYVKQKFQKGYITYKKAQGAKVKYTK